MENITSGIYDAIAKGKVYFSVSDTRSKLLYSLTEFRKCSRQSFGQVAIQDSTGGLIWGGVVVSVLIQRRKTEETRFKTKQNPHR